MREPSRLPEILVSAPFSRGDALAAGVPDRRLRASDLLRLGYSMYLPPGMAEELGTVPGLVCAAVSRTWVSHTTAALLRKIWVPSRLANAAIHISRERGARAVRRPGVIGHQAQIGPGEVEELDGIRMSTPARLWLELGAMLSVDELIILGDHLVRTPRAAFEGRTEPHTTLAALDEMVRVHPRNPGARSARTALGFIRVGSDSPAETEMRLALVRAGLPAPETQVSLRPGDPYSPTADLGYARARVAIQYDGATHLDPDRQSKDNRRDAAFSVAGWIVIKANRDDLHDGFQRVIGLVRAALFGCPQPERVA